MWLPLLRTLTADVPSWLVWKNVDSALGGSGDIDATARPDAYDLVHRRFTAWAGEHGLSPAISCPHIPGGLTLVAPDFGRRFLFEMSVKESKSFRGARLFRSSQLLPLAVMDDRGFRKLRPGAEGLLKLLLNGMRRGGKPDLAGLAAKNVRDLVAEDPEGVARAAQFHPAIARALVRAAEAVSRGAWDRGAALRIEAYFLATGVGSPGVLARRVRFRAKGTSCPVVHALLVGKRIIPDDHASWLAEVATTHAVAGEAS